MKERGKICLKSFSWKTLQNKLKSMNRTDWLMVLLFGILLLIIAIPTGGHKENEVGQGMLYQQKNGMDNGSAKDCDGKELTSEANEFSEENESYRESLEQKLEELLAKTEGVGKVRVMLTLKDSGAHVLDKNVKRDKDASETNTVVYNNTDGEKPYVTNRFFPDVEGVFIVAQGGGNAVVVSNISDVVMALFDIEPHKIKIVKMSD